MVSLEEAIGAMRQVPRVHLLEHRKRRVRKKWAAKLHDELLGAAWSVRRLQVSGQRVEWPGRRGGGSRSG